MNATGIRDDQRVRYVIKHFSIWIFFYVISLELIVICKLNHTFPGVSYYILLFRHFHVL